MNSFLAAAGASIIGISVYNTMSLWLGPNQWSYTKGVIIGITGLALCVLASLAD